MDRDGSGEGEGGQVWSCPPVHVKIMWRFNFIIKTIIQK